MLSQRITIDAISTGALIPLIDCGGRETSVTALGFGAHVAAAVKPRSLPTRFGKTFGVICRSAFVVALRRFSSGSASSRDMAGTAGRAAGPNPPSPQSAIVRAAGAVVEQPGQGGHDGVRFNS